MLFISEKSKTVVDVTKAPYFADNTGKVDCTKALIQALDDVLVREFEGIRKIRQKLLDDPRDNFRIGFENRKMNGIPTVIFPEDPPPARILYFPKGTYLISDTITYTFTNLQNLIDDHPSSDLNRFIHFKGEDMNETVIKLQDSCHAFRQGENKPMVSFVHSNGSNVNMMNSFEDITLNTGCDNLGAVGVRFHSANTGKIKNVRIISPDQSGYVGIDMDMNQENYSENIYIDGFKFGIHANATGHSRVFEHVYMDNIQSCGIYSEMGIVGIRASKIRSFGKAAACNIQGLLTVVDCEIEKLGKRGGEGITNYAGWLYVRNVKSTGYNVTLKNGYDTIVSGDTTIQEYNSEDRYWSLFPIDKRREFIVPEDQPVYEWNGDRSIVAEVDDFGAIGDQKTDSTDAIQAAMNSGKEYIVFGEGQYFVSHEIKIPKTVKAINFMYCDFVLDKDFLEEKDKGLFVIEEDSDEMLFMDDAFVFEKFYGYLRFIRHSAKRDLAVSDVHVQTGAFYFNTVPGSKVFFENVASTMGVFGGIGYGVTPCFHMVGQTVYARQYNPERSAHNSYADNCKIWIYGFKTEGPAGRCFTFVNHSWAEATCGDGTIGTDDGTPCVEIKDSDVFIYLRTSGCGPHHQFIFAVMETKKGKKRVLHAHEVPKYSVEYYAIPGYISSDEQ